MFTMPAACEFCSEACATVHCRADSARLCLTCDRHVHGANALSKRHPRTLLCHSCNVRPAVVRCSSCHSSFCETCDDNKHKFALGTDQHQRHSFQCFTGCPSATELAILWASQANEPRKRAGDMLTSSSSKEGVQYSLESRNGAVAPNPSARSGARGSWSVDTQRMDDNSKIDANMSGSGPPPPLKKLVSTITTQELGHGREVFQQLEKLRAQDPAPSTKSKIPVSLYKSHPSKIVFEKQELLDHHAVPVREHSDHEPAQSSLPVVNKANKGSVEAQAVKLEVEANDNQGGTDAFWRSIPSNQTNQV